jgi:hypothetical protein
MYAHSSAGVLLRKAALSILSVVLLLSCALLLPACQGAEQYAELPPNPFDGTEAAELVASGVEDMQGEGGVLFSYYDIADVVNRDLIFKGTVLNTDLHDMEYTYENGDTDTWYLASVTIRIDEMYAGKEFKPGDVVNARTSVAADPGIKPVEVYEADTFPKPERIYVFFATSLDVPMDSETKTTTRELYLKHGWDKALVETLDMELSTGGLVRGYFPLKDGIISAPLEWATQMDPSYPLSKEQAQEMKERGRYPVGQLRSGRAYFTEDDFKQALAFYRNYWPSGSSVQSMRLADIILKERERNSELISEFEESWRDNSEYWPEIERELKKVQEGRS